jgi:mono/diheme cytochrome c family protein
MPLWGEVLTEEQLDALVAYAFRVSRGAPLELGRDLYVEYCATCHGEFGEGGLNPTRPGDVIAPISSAEYLRTRDDPTLRSIIAQGQPNFGMSPFATAYGGPLEEEEVDAILDYIRSWEADPPVEVPPEIAPGPSALTAEEVFTDICARCHGPQGGGGIGPSLQIAAFQQGNTDQEIFDTISLGHEATAMIAWGEVLTSNQIQGLVQYIRSLGTGEAEGEGEVSFQKQVLPILEARCSACHGSLGGWDASSYESVMNSGEHAPVVIPGDPEGSLLAQMIRYEEGLSPMPPSTPMPEEEVNLIIEWISAGATDN